MSTPDTACLTRDTAFLSPRGYSPHLMHTSYLIPDLIPDLHNYQASHLSCQVPGVRCASGIGCQTIGCQTYPDTHTHTRVEASDAMEPDDAHCLWGGISGRLCFAFAFAATVTVTTNTSPDKSARRLSSTGEYAKTDPFEIAKEKYKKKPSIDELKRDLCVASQDQKPPCCMAPLRVAADSRSYAPLLPHVLLACAVLLRFFLPGCSLSLLTGTKFCLP
jgi:hypothetical protein